MATAVMLNGTSSSGKTTLVRAFQEIAPGIFSEFPPEEGARRIIDAMASATGEAPERTRAKLGSA